MVSSIVTSATLWRRLPPRVVALTAAAVPYRLFAFFLARTVMVYSVFGSRPLSVKLPEVPSVVEKVVQLPLPILYCQILQVTLALAETEMLLLVTSEMLAVTVGRAVSTVVLDEYPPT